MKLRAMGGINPKCGISVVALCFVFLVLPGLVHAAIIADHNAVKEFDQIPAEWLTAAKNLTLHYAHTSHGSQIISGLGWLQSQNSTYAFAVNESETEGLPANHTPSVLRIYDGNPPATYITPEDYWATAAGLNRTRAVAGTGHYNYSMWSWCGQQSSNSTGTVQSYLDALAGLESQYPSMRFIYMTGHTDGGSATLTANNQMIRDYATANNKVLFDFADIESYDPDGNYYPQTTDACPWCETWCANHPSQCVALPDCAHSHGYNCVIKAKAFWWMMARLAGWQGTSTVQAAPVTLSLTSVSKKVFARPASTAETQRVYVNGAGFTSGIRAWVGAKEVRTVYMSNSQIRIRIPTGLMSPGVYDLKVRRTDGSTAKLRSIITIQGRTPAVSSFTPTSVKYSATRTVVRMVTLTGKNFTRQSIVYFGNTKVVKTVFLSSTKLKAYLQVSKYTKGQSVSVKVKNVDNQTATAKKKLLIK